MCVVRKITPRKRVANAFCIPHAHAATKHANPTEKFVRKPAPTNNSPIPTIVLPYGRRKSNDG